MSHITRLQAENIKKLKVIDVRPGTSAGVVPIRGRNAQGKSSTLDAIQMALGGAKFTPSRPIRAGEDEAAIRLELDTGEVIVRRFTSEGGDTLEVTNGEGYKAGSPQTLLNKLFASVAFDPLAFTRLKPAEQLATLRGLVKLDVDVDALNAANQGDYDARRDKNRELDRESTKLEQLPTFPDAPVQKVDEAALEERIASAAETNGQIERRKVNREDFARRLQGNRDRLAQLQEQAAEIAEAIASHQATITEQEQQLADAEPLPDPVDVSDVQQQLREARETNRRIAANEQARVQKLLVETLERESAELTARMDGRKAQIAAAIGRAEMPVPGLGFGDGEVLFNGVPLEQASSAEQLRVSTAIGIASAPKLRVMLVRDGSLLDDEGEKILADMAAAHDFQLWVEAVDTSGTVGIVLEDGAVIAIDGEAAPQPEQIAAPRRRQKKSEIPAQGGGVSGGDDGQQKAVANGDVATEQPQLVADDMAEGVTAGETDDQDGDVQPDADTAPWEDEADRHYDDRRTDEDRDVLARAAAPSLFD